MKRDYLSLETLSAWTKLNDISVHGVAFQKIQAEDGTDKGSAIVATQNKSNDETQTKGSSPEILLRIPADMVLSLQLVETHAKADRHLRDVLEAVGEFGRTARGAILIFLLLQITHSSPDLANADHKIGVSNPWTEYMKYMPVSVPLPVFFTPEEVELLRGTSLMLAVEAKMDSLETEFEHLRQSTESISWCEKYWWGVDTGKLTFEDWKYVDTVYRSRMVDLPGHGHAMVPCIDMANHASEGTVNALYEEDKDSNAVLQLRWEKELHTGDEVTISYGSDKPASEMVFSYGFLEADRQDAKQIFLDLEIPDDDPLKMAKMAFCRDAAGVRLSSTSTDSETEGSTHTRWDSSFVWWACVNEEDGLDFSVLQNNDGKRELRVSWKGEEMKDPRDLKDLLSADPHWEIFHLRAVVIILGRLEMQFFNLRETQRMIADIKDDEDMRALFRPEVFSMVNRLRDLEGKLLEKAIEDLVNERQKLMSSERVTAYLDQQYEDVEEDFS